MQSLADNIDPVDLERLSNWAEYYVGIPVPKIKAMCVCTHGQLKFEAIDVHNQWLIWLHDTPEGIDS